MENIRLAFQGIWGHKMRSVLTMLGIIIGIASIITIVSTIKGTNEQIKQNLIGSGSNVVTVQLYQNSYPYDMRDDFIKQYKAAKEGRLEPSVFITCTYLGDEEDDWNLILVPKILSIGIEIKTKSDPDYCRPAIRKSLVNHLLNPEAVAKVASTYSARESDIITGLADELGAELVTFDSDKRAKAKIPMEMTFSPEKRTDTATALAFLASSEGALAIRRSTSVRGLVISVAIARENIVLP